MEHALTLHRVTKAFGDLRAVDEISLAVPRGTIYGFLGTLARRPARVP